MNWDQLKTILWLRWRLTRNQWARSKGTGEAISIIFAVMLFMSGGFTFLGGLLGGMFGLGKASPVLVWGIWCGLTAGFLFFWMVSLLVELQRSETIDLQRLMHLPVKLGQIFVINFVVSHLTLSIVIFVPAMMGLAMGLAFSRGPSMILLAPLALAMIFMISAWTYCLRGWLATLMNNPRKRRSVTVAIMFVFILLGQGPNIYFNLIHRQVQPAAQKNSQDAQARHEAKAAKEKQQLDQFRALQKYIPPLWLPLGAQGLMEGSSVPALSGMLGCLAIGALGLRRAYQTILKFYRGASNGSATVQIESSRMSSPVPVASTANAGRQFLEIRVPGVPEQASALAVATFRSLLRAPEVKMAWGTSFMVTLILGMTVFMRDVSKVPEAAKPFMATAAVAFSVFMLVQFFTNQFGLDRDGFRALVLSPAERRYILLGKNIACLPVGAVFGIVLVSLIAFRLQLSPLVFGAALLQLAAVLLLAGMVGNLLSIIVPYRVQSGSLKPTKLPGLAMLALAACQIFFPIAMVPAFLPPLAELLWHKAGFSSMVPVDFILSLGLASLLAFVYWQTLAPMGDLLRKSETKILNTVSVQVE